MSGYIQVARRELKIFKTVQIKQIPRSQNSHADALTRLATSDRIEEFDSIPMRGISRPATELAEVTLMIVDSKLT